MLQRSIRGYCFTRSLLPSSSRYQIHNVSEFSTSTRREAYEDTIPNLKIGSHTRVLYQGFTGRQATANAKESIEYGTNIVGGVKPGFTGEHLGLPVLPTIREAMDKLKPDASAVYVPGDSCAKAIMDAIEAEVPLVMAVAEHVPIHDILRIHQMLNTTWKTRFVGANCPGIINTHGKCRLGFQPLPFFLEGKIGIVAKSGTLSYETVASTTRAGLGQSYCISMGGDVIAGTTFVDALKIFEHDEKTEGIVLVGEIGGRAELDAAEWIREYRKRTTDPKPIMAIIGGVHAPPGRIMGHAGAWAAPGEPSAGDKIKVLESVGVTVVDHPEKFGGGMKRLLSQRRSNSASSGHGQGQRRRFHTMRRPMVRTSTIIDTSRRTLYITQSQAFDMLREKGIPIVDQPSPIEERLLAISIDRTSRSPCIIASPTADPGSAQRYPFDYGSDPTTSIDTMTAVSKQLGLDSSILPVLKNLVAQLISIFMTREAFVIETKFRPHSSPNNPSDLQIYAARFGFDDAAFRSAGRQSATHSLRDPSLEEWSDLEAEKYGMIYVKLHSGTGSIGTIVNGAGLAMNTVDALISRGGSPANFCDTGGKATSDTIKNAFRIVTADDRVKVIFVNIFGGLTLADMIAQGIIKAFKELDLKVPVVVRLRGTNEKQGQKAIRESGLKMDSFDGFEDAAARVIRLAEGKEEI